MEPADTPQIPMTETEKMAYIEECDSTGLIDWSKAKKMHFPNLQKSARKIAVGAKAEYEELEGTIDDGI